MFDRRRRINEPLPMVQKHRHLRSGESIPPLPGLLDQIVAFRADAERVRVEPVIDELELAALPDDDSDDLPD